jgi:AsmA protein
MLRRILLVLIALAVVIVLAAIAAVVLIDPDDYREQIAERASQQIGREVRLDGPMELSLFPWLAFEIHDASVGNPPDFATAPNLAEIGRARAGIRLWPLLRGEIEIGAIDFENATFTLVTDRQGRSNLDGLFAAEAPDRPGEPDLSGIQTGSIGLRSVSVVLLDLATDTRQEIAVENFDMAAFSADRDIDIRLRGRVVDDGEVVLDDLDFSGTLRVAANLSRVDLGNWRASLHLPAAEARARAEGDAWVDLAGDIVSVELPRLELDLDLPDMQLGLVLTDALTLTLDDPARVVMAGAEVRVDLPDMQAELVLTDALTLTLADPARVVVSGAEARVYLPDMQAEVLLTDALTVTLDDPVRIAMPGADFRLDDQRLALGGELVLAEPIRGQLDVSGERLDLRVLAALGGDEGEPVADGEEPDFAPLLMVDFRADLRLDELILAEGMTLTQVIAGARLADGVLRLEPLHARLFGGGFEGQAEVDFNEVPPAVHLQPRLSGVLVEQIAQLFSDHVPVAGSGDLALDLRFRGLSPVDILATLDGSGQFQLSEGAVRGINLERLIEQELTVAGLGNVRQAFSGETPFRTLAGSLRAEDGVIALPDLELIASGFGARGSGRIDFAADQVDYRVNLELGDRLLEQLPSRLRSATGGSIPLAIAGPVSAPVISVDLAGIAERAVRDEVGRRLLDRIDRPRPQEPPPEADEETEEGEATSAEEQPERESERIGRQLLRGLIDSRERRTEEPESDEVDDEDEEDEENDDRRDSEEDDAEATAEQE